MRPLYTRPKPPSPNRQSFLKFLVAIANSRKVKICAGPCAMFPPLRTGTESSFLEPEAREFDRTDPLERYKLAYKSSLMMLMLSSIQINHTAQTYRKIGTKKWIMMLIARFLDLSQNSICYWLLHCCIHAFCVVLTHCIVKLVGKAWYYYRVAPTHSVWY